MQLRPGGYKIKAIKQTNVSCTPSKPIISYTHLRPFLQNDAPQHGRLGNATQIPLGWYVDVSNTAVKVSYHATQGQVSCETTADHLRREGTGDLPLAQHAELVEKGDVDLVDALAPCTRPER